MASISSSEKLWMRPTLVSDVTDNTKQHKLISEEAIKAALKADKGDETELLSWTFEDFTAKGDNYATIVTSVKVSFESDGVSESKSYVVKVNPGGGLEAFKPFARALFLKESEFYEKTLPKLNAVLTENNLDTIRVPKFYYSSLKEDNELIFLEDLRPRGFKMTDRIKGMDANHATLVIQELARLHAASFIFLQEKQSLEDLLKECPYLDYDWDKYPGYDSGSLVMMFSPSYSNAAETLEKIGGYERAIKWLMDNKDSPAEAIRRHLSREDPFAMICHGDCWNNNVLFRYDENGKPVEAMLVDLQLNRAASVATDLNYMIANLTGDVRSENEEHFLKSYYDAFLGVLVERPKPFTPQELLREFRSKHEFGFLFAAMSVLFLIMPSNEIPDFHDDFKEEDLPKLMEEWKEKMFSMMQDNPYFKPRFLAVFDYMMEHGVI